MPLVVAVESVTVYEHAGVGRVSIDQCRYPCPSGSVRSEGVKAGNIDQSGPTIQIRGNERICLGTPHSQVQVGLRLESGGQLDVDPVVIPGSLIPTKISPHPELHALNPQNTCDNVVESFRACCKQSKQQCNDYNRGNTGHWQEVAAVTGGAQPDHPIQGETAGDRCKGTPGSGVDANYRLSRRWRATQPPPTAQPETKKHSNQYQQNGVSRIGSSRLFVHHGHRFDHGERPPESLGK